MQFKINQEIQVFKNVLTRPELTNLLKSVFDLNPLWEERLERTGYRNSPFYTIGSPSYLDFDPVRTAWRQSKIEYFNEVLLPFFMDRMFVLKGLGTRHYLGGHSLPGFHIFPPHETSVHFYGRMHTDQQWKFYPRDIPQDPSCQFSFTYVLKLPHSGGGLYVGEARAYYPYEENALYVHSGQFPHAIAPTPGPVLPTDYRITLQGHGFRKDGVAYLYW